MQKTKMICNPIANHSRAWADANRLRSLASEFGAEWVNTTHPRHAVELARQAAEEGYELVIALGGDGTVHEVVNGLMQVAAERRPRLGIVPIGSGNDFAGSLGISTHPATALRQALTGRPHPIDIGRIENSNRPTEYFVNTTGIGFDAVINIRSRQVRRLQGFGLYLAAALQAILFNYTPFRATVHQDQDCWQTPLLMLTLCNGWREGGGFRIAPQASLNDGLLNYTAFGTIQRLTMLYTLLRVMAGTHLRLPYARSGQFTHLNLEADQPLYIHSDGEIYAGFDSEIHNISVAVQPGAILLQSDSLCVEDSHA